MNTRPCLFFLLLILLGTNAALAQNNVAPEYPGGEKALNQYLNESAALVKYVKKKHKLNTEPSTPDVYFKFNINSDGKVTNIKADGVPYGTNRKSMSDKLYDMDESEMAMLSNLLHNMPKWKMKAGFETIMVSTQLNLVNNRVVGKFNYQPLMQISISDFAATNEEVIPIEELVNKKDPENEKSYEKPHTVVEFMPSYPGGEKALYAFVEKTMRYPVVAQEEEKEGKVLLRFIVNKDGSLEDVVVLRGFYPLCDKEAIRIVEMMPKWNPGKQNGRAVRSYFTMPITFKLNNEK